MLTLGSREPVAAWDELASLLSSVGRQIGVAVSHAAEREQGAAQERLASLGRLAAGVAHELRNPLSVVAARLALLEAEVSEGRVPAAPLVSRSIAGMDEAVGRMGRIVEALSTYSKPPRPQPQLVSMSELLPVIRDLVGFEAGRNRVAVTVHAEASLPPVLGDRSQLVQVLVNLATNGIEAMAETGGKLVLGARVVDNDAGGGRALVVEVSDTGCGIPSDLLPKIWEPFYTTKPEGTGLGLSIVRSAVAEQPGAAIGVESRPSGGTTFTLTMPVASAPGGVAPGLDSTG